jgi:hypothetical protein
LPASAKSPVATGVDIASEVVRRFFSVSVCAPLVVPTDWLAKARLAGETVTGA